MIVFQHGRADWVDPAYPVTGPSFNWDTIEWVVIHYTAAIDLPDGDMGEFAYNLPPYLRAIQREYLRRGYSIGYNAAADWLGGTWELRGDTFKCAANADREDTIESPDDKGGDENARTFAILMLVDGQDGATPLAAAAVRGLVAQIREHAPRAVIVLGHRDVDKTQCPGTGVYAQIQADVFEPDSHYPPPPLPTPLPTTDPPKGVATMGAPLVLRYGGTPTSNWSGYYSFDGVARQGVRGLHHAKQLQALGAIDAKTLKPVTDPVWSDVTHTNNAEELDEWLTPGRD